MTENTKVLEEIRQIELEKQVMEEAAKIGLIKPEETSEQPEEVSSQPEETIDTSKYSEDEIKAMEMGWDPEHKGDNFVSAKEFIRVGEIIKAKREARKEADKQISERDTKIESLQQAVNKLVEKYSKAEEIAYQKAIEDLARKEREAEASGDFQAYKEIKDEQARLAQASPAKQPVQQPQYTKEQLEFAERNRSWFNPDNQDLVDTVSATYDFLLLQDRKKGIVRPEADLLIEVENTVKAIPRYANRFPKSGIEKAKEARVSMVEAPSKSSSPSSNRKSALSHEDRVLLAQIRLADPSFTEEKMVEMLSKTKTK